MSSKLCSPPQARTEEMRPLVGVTPVCCSLQVQGFRTHQPESSTHCPVLHLIHDHHPTVAGRVTSTISISLLQTLSKPGASKTPQAGGPEHRAGNSARAGARGELGRSEMVPTRLCLAQAALSSLHPCKSTGALQEPSPEQSWPEGLAGSHCDKFGMSTNPWCTAGGRKMSVCV